MTYDRRGLKKFHEPSFACETENALTRALAAKLGPDYRRFA